GGRGNGGTLIVYEGTITCNGGSYAAGIGTGYYENGGVNVTIMGGIVTAQGSGAGIGAGAGGTTHGTLTLGDGMIVVDQSDNEIDYTTSRPSYMQVKPRP
ncbi:MAG: hypothetical protein J6Y01_09070, partial [Spirochaetales bacterium]|nr:hypothetical protein [Spirochaetales bacterium]